MLRIIITCFIYLSMLFSTTSANAVIIETATTATNIQLLKSAITKLIDKATQSGDYLAFKFAIEAKGIIESWEKSNSNLINEFFKELGNEQQDLFRNFDSILTCRVSVDNIPRLWRYLICQEALQDLPPGIKAKFQC